MAYHVALVTGATSGIGKATCERLALEGIELVITGRNQAALKTMQEELSSHVPVQTVAADLASPEGRQEIIALIHARVPDLVINNAGFGLYGEALTYATQEQAAILEVNGRAVLELTLEAARTLLSHEKRGVILNVSSVAGFYEMPCMAVYAASKAFVNHFSQAIDWEMKPHGIRVLTLCPGMVATDFQKRAGGEIKNSPLKAMSPGFVADQMWKQIEQLRPLVIINWQCRLLTWIASWMPQGWVMRLTQRSILQRISPRMFLKLKK